MTTLGTNKPRAFEGGSRNEFPVIASDIIYEGAAVGLVDATGHARPLTAADRFAGFAEYGANNAAGAAAAINVRVIESGKIQLAVTGALITDVGQPVYATDDDTFTLLPVGGKFIGYVHRFVSANVAIVRFDAPSFRDPYGEGPREVISATKTLDAQDSGKTFFVDADGDGDDITLPAIADGLGGVKIVNIAGFGLCGISISPNGSDKIHGPDLAGADGADLNNTKATARRGDYIVLDLGDADGYVVTEMRGIWASE